MAQSGPPAAGRVIQLQRQNSILSRSSKSSKASVSLSEKVSALVRRRHGQGSETPNGHSAFPVFAVGDHAEAVGLCTIRTEESIESNVVCEATAGTRFQVLALGEGRRVKVVTMGKSQPSEGWISCRTAMDELLIQKVTPLPIDVFTVDSKHEVKHLMTVREEEALESDAVCDLPKGTLVTILELGSKNERRARIRAEKPSAEGWISVITKQGDFLLGALGESAPDKSQPSLLSSSAKIKMLLEASRAGDLDTVKKVIESTIGITSKFYTRPNLNASDIRGKTSLMFAAAFGNRDCVEYLLGKRPELDANALDDTQKSALHHACKRAKRNRGDSNSDVQGEIVGLLLDAGLALESRDHNGSTALMLAAANGDEAVCKRLLAANAEVNSTDFGGDSVIEYAKRYTQTAICELLRNAGAVESRDSEDEPPVVKTSHVPAPAVVQEPSTPIPEPSGADQPGEASAKKKSSGKKKAGTGKKKAAASKKKAAVSAAIMDAVAEETEPVQIMDVAKEEEDEKTRALRKIDQILPTASLKELEAAIEQAQAAGASEQELEAAQKKTQVLKARLLALNELRAAMGEKVVKDLKEAIAKAEEHGVDKKELDAARKVLKVEEPKQEARDLLRGAQSSGNSKDLKKAIEAGKKVGLPDDELKEFEDLLKGAESKEKAEKALNEAINTKSVAGLKFAIKQAKDAGVDQAQISNAEEILKVEEPKEKAREKLAEALKTDNMEVLKAALAEGKALGLTPDECMEVEQAIKRKEEIERCMAGVTKAMADSMEADMKDIDSVRAAKENLAEAIREAIEAGVSETLLGDAEFRRKKLHNTIEDLKGSIRVFCRIRPLSSKEKGAGDKVITKQLDPMTLQVDNNDKFTFDAVFTPGTQDEIFEDCKDLVQSAVDGYNVTLFAYGQTGAGKTFTMTGVPGAEGVSPRTIREIYDVMEKGKSRFTYTVLGSMLELHKMDLVDLVSKGDKKQQQQKLNVRLEKSGKVIIEHLTEQQCQTAQELEALMNKGFAQRSVSATKMNSESSRSHSILIIHIVSTNRETGDQLRGKMLIVDLAGSERLAKSQTEGDARNESIEINKSLTALGDVIEALTKQGGKGAKTVIPYRNHKLTQLMQDSLGGSAKTLMFVNCSPAGSNKDETVQSLKYAQRAKHIQNKQAKN